MALAAAVILALIATSCINYSGYMQKRELNNLPRIERKGFLKTLKAFLTCIPWLEAQGLQFLGTFVHAIAAGLAPLSVVQPINTSGVLLLALLAITKLGEKASTIDWAGIGSIILGLILLGLSLRGGEHAPLRFNPYFLWFLIILLFFISGTSFFAAFKRKDERTPVMIAIGNGVLLGLNAVLVKLAVNDLALKFWNESLGKALSSPYIWMVLVISLVTLLLSQIALQRGKAIIVIPVIYGLSNLIPILIGLIALGEHFPTRGILILMRFGSILFILGGAVLLSLGKEDLASAP